MPAKAAKVPKTRPCPKCEGAMEEGIIFDRGYGNLRLTPQWSKGESLTEFSWKTGLKVPAGRLRKVTTWRCAGCGFLESYAK